MSRFLLLAALVLVVVSNAVAALPEGPVGCALPPPPSVSDAEFTDLSSAPVGAAVTVFGSGFGAAGEVTLGGVSQKVLGFSDRCVIFTVSGTGGELVVGGKRAGTLPVHAGRILEATPARLKSVWRDVRPGDVIYLRAGDYASIFGEGDWCMECTFETFKRGTKAQPIAIIAYPGELATLRWVPGSMHSVIALGDQDSRQRRAEFLTFANLRIVGHADCIYGGGNTSDPYGGRENTGATDIRIVNVTCEIEDAESNTMTGLIALQGNHWTILGSTFVDPPNRKIINNNHAIYISGGADDVEIGYNRLVNLHMGHVIQVHQDGKPFVYERIWIHDNELEGRADMDMRGVNVANVDEASSVLIERNTFRNLGQEFSGVAVYRGNVTIKDNRFYGVRAPDVALSGQYGGTRHVIVSGNRFETVGGYKAVDAANGAKFSDLHLEGNHYCGVSPQERLSDELGSHAPEGVCKP